MRRPRLSEIFDRQKSLGISNFLIGHASMDDIIYESGFENLFFVPAGVVPPNPSELIAGKKTVEFFDYLRREFEVIIVDTPPIGLVADARLLMQFSDSQLFVVRSGITQREHFTNTIGELIQENIGHLGLVLNDVSPLDHSYGYRNNGYYGKEHPE
jgi:capsular exopolysaccharide synthesis family protein